MLPNYRDKTRWPSSAQGMIFSPPITAMFAIVIIQLTLLIHCGHQLSASCNELKNS